MQLVIAEKPSVAMALSKVLGAKSRGDGYMEGGGWLVSWCIGHLVELAPADAYDPRYSKWNYADLPILPEPWQYQVLPDTKKQFETLKSLMHRADVTALICATDAGREGELIFRLTYHLCGCTKPVKRLWISSMEETAIQKGFDRLLDGKNYDNLYAAALCRAKADWLIGINGTRLFTTLYQGKTLNVGRVQTPTLALLAEREAAISGFRKEKFYTVELELDGFHAASERFASKTDAGRLRTGCVGKPATVQTVSQKEKTERPPRLYDLTTLQREANRLFDYTAQQTLDYLQALYEKRLATYPRTDSRYLTEDMASGLPSLCQSIAASLPFAADLSLLVNATQVIDNSKVTDHHAILPTAETAKTDLSALPSGERNILFLAAARLLCAVGEPHTYAETAVTLECGGAVFSAKGKTEIAAGWTDGTYGITISNKLVGSDTNPGSTADENVLNMIKLLESSHVFKAGPNNVQFFTGSFHDCFANIENTLGIDTKSETTLLTNQISVLNQTSNSRDGVSGVQLDEEGMNLLHYNQSYTAAARLMTTLDEALDVLINKTGVVGR